jgi:hypothetical protein
VCVCAFDAETEDSCAVHIPSNNLMHRKTRL